MKEIAKLFAFFALSIIGILAFLLIWDFIANLIGFGPMWS
jgi:hypothetical protein